jgi:SHS2 domain-containing protein
MSSLVCDTATVRNKEAAPIVVRDENLDYLFFAWLDELVFLTSAKRFLFCDFKADVRNGVARGIAIGEHMDPSRHDLRLEIKAVTYHELKVARQGDLWTATVIFDV